MDDATRAGASTLEDLVSPSEVESAEEELVEEISIDGMCGVY